MLPLYKTKAKHIPMKKRISDMVQFSKDKGFPITRAQAKQLIRNEMKAQVWVNDVYTVLFRENEDADEYVFGENWKGKCAYISIRRNDRNPVDSWRDFQEIKNQLVGPNREAVQLYPDEDRLTDTANQYHLWVLPEGEIFPMGFVGRAVVDGNHSVDGMVVKQSNR